MLLAYGVSAYQMRYRTLAFAATLALSYVAMSGLNFTFHLGLPVALAAYAAVLAGWGRRRTPTGLRARDGWTALGLLIWVSLILSASVARTSGLSPTGNLSLLVALYVLTPVAEAGVSVAVLHRRRMLSSFLRANYRWRPSSWRHVGMGLAIGIGLSVATAVILAAQHALTHTSVHANNPFVYAPGLSHPTHLSLLPFILAGAVVILAPLAEEALFRGILFQSLRTQWGTPTAAVIAGILFGAAHLNLTLMAPLALAGIVLNGLYARTRSLIPSTVAHASLNALSVMTALFSFH